KRTCRSARQRERYSFIQRREVTVKIFFRKIITMKKAFLLIAAVVLTGALAAQAGNADQKKRAASDDAVMQTVNPKVPTRVIKNGTRVSSLQGSYDVLIELAK
ncbi:MAG: hypothetical protein ACRCUT_02290, partial [Spirochaetota bacterium]